MRRWIPFLAAFATTALTAGTGAAASLADLFAERIASVVSVSYTLQREIDRQQHSVVGLVVDKDGLIVLLGSAIPEWLPPERLTELRVHPPASRGEGHAATYLGQDYLNGWHYLRVDAPEDLALRPITAFASTAPAIGEELWGICLTDGELDYLPYFRSGRLSAAQDFPLTTGFLTADVATPGGPVFDLEGRFAGWAGPANAVEREMWIAGEVYRVSLRNNVESHAFLFADDFLAQLGNVPPAVEGAPRPWLGLSGLRPVDADTAAFLGLEDQGAVVVSEVVPDSPAAAAGFAPRDIIIGVNGRRLPRFKPDAVVQTFLERSIRGAAIGAALAFTVVRGEEELELEATLVQGPKPVREARRRYFEDLGLTIRELVLDDALERRVDFATMEGVLASFVQPNSPPSAAGLQPADWIVEVDGAPVGSFEDAVTTFDRVVADTAPGEEYVLLVRRQNETAVLRVRRD